MHGKLLLGQWWSRIIVCHEMTSLLVLIAISESQIIEDLMILCKKKITRKWSLYSCKIDWSYQYHQGTFSVKPSLQQFQFWIFIYFFYFYFCFLKGLYFFLYFVIVLYPKNSCDVAFEKVLFDQDYIDMLSEFNLDISK